MKALEHLRTINHHKKLVMEGCFKIGLYRQGLLHDLSKYTPTEFLVGCKYYQGNMSPNNAEREEVGYSSAWLHHKGRNKHHMEYWIDYGVGKEGTDHGVEICEIAAIVGILERLHRLEVRERLEPFQRGTPDALRR